MNAVGQTLIDVHGSDKNRETQNKTNSISALRNPTEYEQALIRGAGLLSNSGTRGCEMANRAIIGEVIQVLASEGAALIFQVRSKSDILRWRFCDRNQHIEVLMERFVWYSEG